MKDSVVANPPVAPERVVRALPAWTLAVTGGKGGVGKTHIAANLAIALAARSLKTLAVDLDLGLANLDVLFGVTATRDLRHVLDGDTDVSDCVFEVPGGISLLPASSGVARMAQLDRIDRTNLRLALARAVEPFDAVVLDTAAGIGPSVIENLLIADRVIVVTTPDPAALTDAYALVKVLSSRAEKIPPLHLLVNQVTDGNETLATAQKLRRVTRGFLGVELDLLGGIPRDPAFQRANRRQQPLLLDRRPSAAARVLERVAGRLADERRDDLKSTRRTDR